MLTALLLVILILAAAFATIQESAAVRNAKLDAIETAIGTAAVLKIFTGAQPANCAAANSGTELASITCPSDWAAAASGGVKAKSGTWSDSSANASGVAGHFRLYASDGTTCHMQGSITASGGGGDMTLDNTTLAAGQVFTINTFSLTEGNA